MVVAPARRQTVSLISTVTNRGPESLHGLRGKGALNVGLFLTFLRRLIRASTRKVVLIVDNLKVHRAHRVAAWVAAHSDRIALFFLPPYAPEHNPDELLNAEVKRRLAKRPAVRHRDQLENPPEIPHARAATDAREGPRLLPRADHRLRRLITIFARRQITRAFVMRLTEVDPMAGTTVMPN